MAATKSFEKEVRAQMEASRRAYNKGDQAFFSFFAKDATIFSAGSTEAIRGREAYKSSYGPKLKGDARSVKILEQSLQVIGDKAVIAQTAQIRQSGITANIRQTIVWGQTEEGVKVHHLHTALIGAPAADRIADKASSIRVINERIATVAAVLGVAQ